VVETCKDKIFSGNIFDKTKISEFFHHTIIISHIIERERKTFEARDTQHRDA
jgi:hypothetical protein